MTAILILISERFGVPTELYKKPTVLLINENSLILWYFYFMISEATTTYIMPHNILNGSVETSIEQ